MVPQGRLVELPPLGRCLRPQGELQEQVLVSLPLGALGPYPAFHAGLWPTREAGALSPMADVPAALFTERGPLLQAVAVLAGARVWQMQVTAAADCKFPQITAAAALSRALLQKTAVAPTVARQPRK